MIIPRDLDIGEQFVKDGQTYEVSDKFVNDQGLLIVKVVLVSG